MMMTIRHGAAQLTLPVDGAFDLAQARRVLEQAVALPEGRLAIDLRGLREIHDSALAWLVAGLGASNHPVDLQGLTDHQRRMLHYLAPRRPAPKAPLEDAS
jgi:hypothetical protein